MNFKGNLQKPTQELGRSEEVKCSGWRRPKETVERAGEFTSEEEGKGDVQFKPIRPGLRGIQGHTCSEMGGKIGQE